MMKVALIDDEKPQLDYLEIQLNRLTDYKFDIIKISDPIDGLKTIERETFDLIFLDVEMPGLSGFEIIEIIGSDRFPPLIFTTAYSKYAVEAFKVSAIDYLLKPIEQGALLKALKKVKTTSNNVQAQNLSSLIEHSFGTNKRRLVIAQGQTYLLINFDDIIRIEGSGSYADFYLISGEKLTASKPLNSYWKKLQYCGFIRTHQSHVVNNIHISGYSKSDGGEVLLIQQHAVPVNAAMKTTIKRHLGI